MPQQHDQAVFEKLGKYWQEDIVKSPEYTKAVGSAQEAPAEQPKDTRF